MPSVGPYQTGVKSPYGDSERFMVHYGYYLWDWRWQPLPHPESILEVNTARPIRWKLFASQRLLGAGHRQIIVPLLNKAEETEVVGSTITGPVEQATVSFQPNAGEQVTAILLAPEPVAHRSVLPTTTTPDGRVHVTVPTFYGWTNVVFDCQAH